MRHAAHDRDVVLQPRAAADADVRTDDREWADFDVLIDLGPGIDRHVFRNEASHAAAP